MCGDGKEFNVHKVVLCGHSSFFYSACTVDMKVSNGKDLVAPAFATTSEDYGYSSEA